jgi:hypothetical protein
MVIHNAQPFEAVLCAVCTIMLTSLTLNMDVWSSTLHTVRNEGSESVRHKYQKPFL